MTESEWDRCTDPEKMLEFLRSSGKLSERKARLFAVACCRRIWDIVESWYHQLAEVAESYADGQATQDELLAARQAAHDPDWTAGLAFEEAAQLEGITETAVYSADNAADAAADRAADYPDDPEDDPAWVAARKAEFGIQAAVLRDIVGPHPFRELTIDLSLLKWNDGRAVKLAQDIYDGRTFERMPELAAALEQAGCDHEEVLAHLREQGKVHVRGCWVLDLLLGKH